MEGERGASLGIKVRQCALADNQLQVQLMDLGVCRFFILLKFATSLLASLAGRSFWIKI